MKMCWRALACVGLLLLICAGNAEAAQYAAAEDLKPVACLAFDDNQQITVRGTIMQSATTEKAEGVSPHKFMAIVLDSPICFTSDLEEKLGFVAVDQDVSMKWLGHYVFVTGNMTASGEGWYIAVHRVKDIKQ